MVSGRFVIPPVLAEISPVSVVGIRTPGQQGVLMPVEVQMPVHPPENWQKEVL